MSFLAIKSPYIVAKIPTAKGIIYKDTEYGRDKGIIHLDWSSGLTKLTKLIYTLNDQRAFVRKENIVVLLWHKWAYQIILIGKQFKFS